jgi:hypothetical protein
MGPRETIRRCHPVVRSVAPAPEPETVRSYGSIATASTLRLQASGGSGATMSTAGRAPATAVSRVWARSSSAARMETRRWSWDRTPAEDSPPSGSFIVFRPLVAWSRLANRSREDCKPFGTINGGDWHGRRSTAIWAATGGTARLLRSTLGPDGESADAAARCPDACRTCRSAAPAAPAAGLGSTTAAPAAGLGSAPAATGLGPAPAAGLGSATAASAAIGLGPAPAATGLGPAPAAGLGSATAASAAGLGPAAAAAPTGLGSTAETTAAAAAGLGPAPAATGLGSTTATTAAASCHESAGSAATGGGVAAVAATGLWPGRLSAATAAAGLGATCSSTAGLGPAPAGSAAARLGPAPSATWLSSCRLRDARLRHGCARCRVLHPEPVHA